MVEQSQASARRPMLRSTKRHPRIQYDDQILRSGLEVGPGRPHDEPVGDAARSEPPFPGLGPILVGLPTGPYLEVGEPGPRHERVADAPDERFRVIGFAHVRHAPAVLFDRSAPPKIDEPFSEQRYRLLHGRATHAQLQPSPAHVAHPPENASFTRDQSPLCALRRMCFGAGDSSSRKRRIASSCSGVSSSGVQSNTLSN